MDQEIIHLVHFFFRDTIGGHKIDGIPQRAQIDAIPQCFPGDIRCYSLYTPEMNLLAETSETTATTPPIAYEYVWFGGKPVAQVDVATSTTRWTFTDP